MSRAGSSDQVFACGDHDDHDEGHDDDDEDHDDHDERHDGDDEDSTDGDNDDVVDQVCEAEPRAS